MEHCPCPCLGMRHAIIAHSGTSSHLRNPATSIELPIHVISVAPLIIFAAAMSVQMLGTSHTRHSHPHVAYKTRRQLSHVTWHPQITQQLTRTTDKDWPQSAVLSAVNVRTAVPRQWSSLLRTLAARRSSRAIVKVSAKVLVSWKYPYAMMLLGPATQKIRVP